MPQEFHIVRCYQCSVFQVHQVKKVNTWSCKMCGEKQSLKKVYFVGCGADCRQNVQRLNLMQGESHQTACHPDVAEVMAEKEPENLHQEYSRVNPDNQPLVSGTKWIKYLESPEQDVENGPIPEGMENWGLRADTSRGQKRKRKGEKYSSSSKSVLGETVLPPVDRMNTITSEKYTVRPPVDRMNTSCSRLHVLCAPQTRNLTPQTHHVTAENRHSGETHNPNRNARPYLGTSSTSRNVFGAKGNATEGGEVIHRTDGKYSGQETRCIEDNHSADLRGGTLFQFSSKIPGFQSVDKPEVEAADVDYIGRYTSPSVCVTAEKSEHVISNRTPEMISKETAETSGGSGSKWGRYAARTQDSESEEIDDY